MSFWKRLWNGSLAWFLAKQAKAFGIEQVVIQKVQGGYLKGKKLFFDTSEIIPDDLPICVELLDEKDRLIEFSRKYCQDLKNCKVLLLQAIELV